ncbi:hypothetical protein E3E12_08000 [Formicincola oecophyllae]|uniref:Uncharacterized protein n=1 Tax=Formicincola oecophyllae TaxID=2558361 RepID=A0A4Y6UC41_9PROT|nr:baseplate J/gp47 family protein [Formicincola oecophyllae]QDH14138.1 hypothetical protein E3E12_08000 [Formicincola oecophyllae]
MSTSEAFSASNGAEGAGVGAFRAETSVPAPQLTDAGLAMPAEAAILAGVQSDINEALGGGTNPALNTPQGQIAMSMTAILGDALECMLEVLNGVDPARSSGRLQDAIGRIYFMERLPATPTLVEVALTLTGNSLPTIAAGTTLASDQAGNLYAAQSDISFPPNTPSPQYVTLACQAPGPVECPAGALALYRGNMGLAALANPAAGIPGQAVESRAAFERRRALAVEGNARSSNGALLGALLDIPGVQDALVVDNPTTAEAQQGGITLPPHTLYAVVLGGNAEDIGQAILAKKPPGCATHGAQSVTVQDNASAYGGQGPRYTFQYDQAQTTTVHVAVTLATGPHVPSDAALAVQRGVLAWFEDADTRPRLGGTLYAGRLIGALNAVGDWVEVLDCQISTIAGGTGARLTLPINQLPTVDASTITVTMAA